MYGSAVNGWLREARRKKDMAEVFASLQDAKDACAKLSKRYRVYRVYLGKRTVYVPAADPGAAMGIAGPTLGLRCEPAIPRILSDDQRAEVEALANLPEAEKARVRKILGLP
jgi:hypothetical protein